MQKKLIIAVTTVVTVSALFFFAKVSVLASKTEVQAVSEMSTATPPEGTAATPEITTSQSPPTKSAEAAVPETPSPAEVNTLTPAPVPPPKYAHTQRPELYENTDESRRMWRVAVLEELAAERGWSESELDDVIEFMDASAPSKTPLRTEPLDKMDMLDKMDKVPVHEAMESPSDADMETQLSEVIGETEAQAIEQRFEDLAFEQLDTLHLRGPQ